MLPEPIAVTLMVTEVLESMDVPYLIGGSLASSMYGIVRATMDADIVADLDSEHGYALAKVLASAFYLDVDAIQDAIQRRSSFNLIHLATMFRVDVFVPAHTAFSRTQFSRRVPRVLSTDPERSAYFASPEDIVLAKLDWYRLGGQVSDRQWRDVVGVLAVQADWLDMEYMRCWATNLGLAEMLEKVLDEAHHRD
jgi:hypothetical protein